MPKAFATLSAIDKAVLSKREPDHRRHLGASVIGDKCDRAIWYKFRWATRELFDGRMLRLFNRGHREEAHFAKLLRDAGMDVWLFGDATAKDNHDVRMTGADGHFGGTPDGVVAKCPDIPDGEPALLEFKTASFDMFAKFKEEGVIKQSWKYFVQMQLYMKALDLNYALFLMVNKDNDELHGEVIARDDAIAIQYHERAEKIIYAEEPPPRIATTPGHYNCRFCPSKNTCFFSEPPEINCRTCVHASVGPAGTWVCARGLPEIDNQQGCAEHLYNPVMLDIKEVVDGDFDGNWLDIRTDFEVLRIGPRNLTSHRLKAEGFLQVPF